MAVKWKTPQLAPNEAEGESAEGLLGMIAGKPYLAGDKYVDRVRDSMVEPLWQANQERDMAKRMVIFRKHIEFREGPRKRAFIAAPFTCEYGFNISFGDDSFCGPNCTFLDVCPIWIGDRTMIGANTQLYTPQHPIMPEERDGLNGAEWAKPITIGNDCWIGGGAIILAGVTIGDGCTVGAGSVVTKDVEPRCVVVGNPARVIKRLPEAVKNGNVE